MKKVLSFAQNGINYHVFSFTNGHEGKAGVTVKDIGIEGVIEHALKNNANVITDVTSGNYGVAIKNALARHNFEHPKDRLLAVHITGPGNDNIGELVGNDYITYPFHGGTCISPTGDIFSVPLVHSGTKWLSEQDRLWLARQRAKQMSPKFKVKNVVDVTHFVPPEYKRQAQEILTFKQDGQPLDYLAVPVGSGRVFVSFSNSKNDRTKLIGLVPKGENPIYHDFVFQRGKGHYEISGFNPKSGADKLSCPYTDLLPQIRVAQSQGHQILELDEDAVKEANLRSFEIGDNLSKRLLLENSASVGFSLLDTAIAKAQGIKPGQHVGIFVTGLGVLNQAPYWTDSLRIK